MTTDEAIQLEIPLDENRFLDVLGEAQWRSVSASLRHSYEVHALYAGTPGGVGHGRILRLTAGNPDAAVRVAVDCVAATMSRVLLAAARAAVRACGARTGERLRMLQGVALLFHFVDLHDELPAIQPVPAARGLEGALSLAQSPGQPTIWSLLEASTEAFQPTVVLDVRDAGGAATNADLALVMYTPGQADGAATERGTGPGSAEGTALVRELRDRGVVLYAGDARGREHAGLRLDGGALLVQRVPTDPPSTHAAAAASGLGALGFSAIALGDVEPIRAAALDAAIAGTIVQAIRGFPSSGG